MENEPEGDLIGLKNYDHFRYGRKNTVTCEVECDCANRMGFDLYPVEELEAQDDSVALPDISHLVSKASE
jgi:hypothetical protein